jgi:hypothetical protein
MEVSGQLHAPAALSLVPIGYEAGWAPEPIWTLWRGEKSYTARNQTQAVQPVAMPTDLFRSLVKMQDN